MEMPNQPAQAGSMPEPQPMGKQIKIPSTSLPAGAAQGDTITLKISNINEATGEAYLVVDSSAKEKDETPEGEHSEPDADEGDEESSDLDTKTLLGPMDGLKNYLVQKSMDVPKNQGRS